MWILLLLCLRVAALDSVAEAIDQAQTLAMKKNRRETCAVLTRALADSTTAKASRARLTEALTGISRVFFTDKGQRAFESGQSQMFDNPDMAMSQFREALQVEDGNVAILTSMAKILLMKQDCDGALAQVSKARALNPQASEPAVLELRALICQKSFALLSEKAKALPALEHWEEQYVQFLLAQNFLEEDSPRKAFDVLSHVAEDQPAFPETYLYLARAGNELDKPSDNWLQKYISLCRAVTSKERKRYSLEPRLCAHMKEAEDELAKKSTDL